ncbi:glycosyltransferase [Lactobacillus acidophilus DSM 20079 = JCM 1132 = NBRC 13951 = CIP 76.13]|nr:glycosyltransferase [Lactobacillus acidophilus DSM 20079 = JCM 1132 = NBRC 13951 = CIP 76.13]
MSTDGTLEMLQPLINSNEIIYHSTGKNIGGAGGFYEGIKLAYEMGYKYFWLMDDDCIPTSSALEKLMNVVNEKKNFGFLVSKALWKDGEVCKMNIPKIKLTKQVNDFSKKVIQIKMGTFVSFLTSREVVEKVGLPIKEFFIWGDDLEYSQRISQKFPSYLVTNSLVYHETKLNEGSNIALDSVDRLKRYKLAYRNEVVLFKEMGLQGQMYQYFRLVLHCGRILFKSKDHKKERLNIIFQGTRAGYNFHPVIKNIK